MTDETENRGNGSGFFTGMLIGAASGFIAGVLLAPKTGEETRALIMDRSQEWRDKADELTASARERLQSATTEGKRAAREARGVDDFEDLDLDDEEL